MSNLEFLTVVKNQFPSKEERIATAVNEFKTFLRDGSPHGVSLEEEFTERYLAILAACELDEARAKELFDDCVDGVETYGEA